MAARAICAEFTLVNVLLGVTAVAVRWKAGAFDVRRDVAAIAGHRLVLAG